MKKKKIMNLPVKKPKKIPRDNITVQESEGYIVMDIWKRGKLDCRHAMDLKTGEYGTYYYDTGIWSNTNLNNAAEPGRYFNNYWGYECLPEKNWQISEEDKKLIKKLIEPVNNYKGIFDGIMAAEWKYSSEKNQRKQESKERRIRELMDMIPTPGKAIIDWITETAVGNLQYALYKKTLNIWHCTACGHDFTDEAAGIKIKDKMQIQCPKCKAILLATKRKSSVAIWTHMTVIDDVDEHRGIERFFQVKIEWKDRRKTYIEENIRLMMMRTGKHACKIYYNDGWGDWSEGNRANRQWNTSYLWPDKNAIRAGLKGTAYNTWMDVMPMLAEAGQLANYNKLLYASDNYLPTTAEYLLKGRFYRLLTEESESIHFYYGSLGGATINIYGKTIEEVLDIDKQSINRLRQANGGKLMLQWLQWAAECKRKISSECISWMEKAGITAGEFYKSRAKEYLSPEQLMNYISRQKKEEYKTRCLHAILEQYEDYLSMAEELGKHMDDEMVYRPRELKRRHDEAVEECNRRREELQIKRDKELAAKQAKQMREKYPGYEEILEEIREKLEYGNDTYRIVVPKDFLEITAEGMALHHCVGNTERYFDRIVSRETYICFLRQQAEPDVPYYTIEVEPGGTIRQHRGMYDEEPEIEEIKPFLREWQKVIRSRMRKEDHEYAKKSEVLRAENIEELKAKNNTRVLEGLMEDLMEVV